MDGLSPADAMRHHQASHPVVELISAEVQCFLGGRP